MYKRGALRSVVHSLGALVVLTGCSVNSVDYYYLLLEGDDLTVEKQGQVHGDGSQALYFRNEKDMPLAYSIHRERYDISVVLPTDSYHALLYFSARDASGNQLYVGGRENDQCTYLTASHIYETLGNDEATNRLGLYWVAATSPLCEVVGLHIDHSIPLQILVRDGQGNLLGTEELTYRVMPNGSYWAVTWL